MSTNNWEEDVHLQMYTVPAICLLAFAARPLLCRSDVMKMLLISAAALTYATQLHGGEVSSTHHPVSVIAQATAITLLWSLFCFRWSTPCFYFNFDGPSYRLIRWAPISALGVVMLPVLMERGQDAPSHRDGWSLLAAVAIMWYGSGNFFVRRIAASTVAFAVPTLYLCWADRMCRGDEGPGDVSPQPSFPWASPEHAAVARFWYYAAVNALVVLAVNCFDKATGVAATYTSEFPHQFDYSQSYAVQLLSAFLTAECSLPADVVQDIRKCFHVLNNESTTFATAVLLFQCGTRLDMVVVYAFGRLTDEMFDRDVDLATKQRDLKMCYDYMNEIFANRKTRFHVKRKPEMVDIDWTKYESRLNDSEMASFRALARVAYYLPPAMLFDLLDAYRRDIDDKMYETKEDLMTYTHQIAGITALTVCIIMYRDYNDRYFNIVEKGKKGLIIEKAYEMGQAIQFVNISRDIVTDSISLGRCYIPVEYMDGGKDDARTLRQERNPRSLGDTKLKRYANKMISLTEKFQSESDDFFKSLPIESRGLILALTDIYRGYIPAIQSSTTYPTNAKLSRWKMIKIGLHSLYVKSLQYGL